MSAFLEPATILILSALLSFMMFVVMRSIDRGVSSVIRGVSVWACAYLAFTLCAVLLMTRNVLPAFISVIVANTMLATGMILLHYGMTRFRGRPAPLRLYLLLLSLFVAAFIVFTYPYPHYDLRVITASVFVVLIMGLSLKLLLSTGQSPLKQGEKLVSLALGIAMLGALVRGLDALSLPNPQLKGVLFDQHMLLPLYLTVNALSIVFVGIGLIVMIHEHLRKDLHDMASYDSLTGVLSRPVIMSVLDKTLAKLVRNGEPFGLMMFDIDHFKRVNDQYGHQAGDALLAGLVKAIENSLRRDTYIGRYGGEEFVIILTHLDDNEVASIGERIRDIAENTVVEYQGEAINCTISIGGANINRSNPEAMHDPIGFVDAALYWAKQSGRNTVVVSS